MFGPERATSSARARAAFVEQLIECATLEKARRMLRKACQVVDLALCEALKARVAREVRTDVKRAQKLAALCQLVARRVRDPRARAVAAHARAMVLDSAGDYRRALPLYEQAERLYEQVGASLEAARIRRAKMGALMYLGRYAQALSAARAAYVVFAAHRQRRLKAEVLANLGAIYHHLDRYPEALACLREARRMLSWHRDGVARAHVELNLAIVHVCLGHVEAARRGFEQARAQYERLGLSLMVVQAEYNRASLELGLGNLYDALRLFLRAKTAARALGERTIPSLCDLDLAEVYLHLNAFAEAVASAESALEAFEAAGMPAERARARLLRGLGRLHMKQWDRAREDLKRAREEFSTLGNEIAAALADFYLAELFRQQGRWRQSERLAERAYAVFHRHRLGVKVATVLLHLALLKRARGSEVEARRLAAHARRLLRHRSAPWVLWRAHALCGQLAEAQGHRRRAMGHYREALRAIEHCCAHLPVDEMKATFLSDKLAVYQALARMFAEEGNEEAALTYTEAAKARVLRESFQAATLASETDRSQVSPHGGGRSSRILARWRRLRQELDAAYTHLDRLRSYGQIRHARIAALQRSIRKREAELQQLLPHLRWAEVAREASPPEHPIELSRLRAALAPDEVVIEYIWLDDAVSAFLLERERLRLMGPLTTSERLEPLLARLRFHVNHRVLDDTYIRRHARTLERALRETLRALYEELLAPLRAEILAKRLIIVPAGALHYVPFHALFDGTAYMVEDHEVTYSPSAMLFRLCRERAAQQGGISGEGALLVGVPDEQTPHIEEEVRRLGRLIADARLLLGEAATSARFLEEAPHARLLHVAAHAVFRADNPLFSAVRLYNSWLTFYDLWQLRCRAELVVLSGCQTGLPSLSPGDEMMGLLRGFLAAGVPSLVLSLWAAHDAPTTEFMEVFYRQLSDGRSKREAIARAYREMKARYADPYFWAPFFLMGSPE